MKRLSMAALLAGIFLAVTPTHAITINLGTGELHDQNGVILADGAKLLLMASTTNASFGNLTSANLASATSFTNEPDDIILAEYNMDSTTFQAGSHIQAIVFNNAANGGPANLTAGDPLLFVWYADPVGATSPGSAKRFGTFRTDAVVDGSDTGWVVPAGNGDTVTLNFFTINAGGTQPETAGNASQITAGTGLNNPPMARCQSVTNTADANCQATITAAQVDNGSSDEDTDDTLTLTLAPAGPYSLGTTPVTLTVSDNRGGTNTCQTTVTVFDTTLPTISCPSTVITAAAPGQASIAVAFAPVISDNCSDVTVVCVPPSGFDFPIGTTNVLCTATDAAGNQQTCSFSVIVTSVSTNLPPVALCQAVTAAAGPDCRAVVTADQVDNESFDVDGSITNKTLHPVGPYDKGTNTVTLTVTDNQGATGTCTAQIIVVDTTPPTVTCAANIVATAAADQTTVVVTFPPPTVSDNCAGASVSCLPVSGSEFLIGTTPVTCTATDADGNTNSCTFTVTVNPPSPAPQDLAVIKLRAPKSLSLSAQRPFVEKSVKVQIQNRSPHAEVISNFTGLVTLTVQSLGTNCVVFTPVLVPQRELPVTLKPKQKFTVAFDVMYFCPANPTSPKISEFVRHVATVNHTAINGLPDTHPADDVCPRAPLGLDPSDPAAGIVDIGCGAKNPDGTLGADVLTKINRK